MAACHLKSYRPDLGYGRITGEAYKDIVQHLFTCFSYLGLPKILKTDNAPLKLRRGCLLTLNDFQGIRRWGWRQHPWKNTYLITEI